MMKLALKLALATGLAFGASQTLAQEPVKVGALYPFSGGLALLGDESFRVRGDAVDTNQAVGEARRLTSVERVPVIFGTYSSSLSVAATQVAELAGIPYFEMGAISDPITERGFKYTFRTNPTSRSFANRSIDALIETVAPALNVQPKDLKIGIIHEDSLYGQTVSSFQVARAKEKGLNVVETLPYSAKSVDLTPVILRLKSAGVDIVLQTSYQNDTVLFFRQMKDQGFKPKMVMGIGGGYSLRDTVQAVGAENMEGALNVDFTQYRTNPQAAPGINEFVKKYEAKYSQPPRSGHSLANYMGANVFLDALAAAKDMKADTIREAVMRMDIPEGKTPTGWGVKFDEKGQNTRVNPYLMQWQGGELVTVFPAEAAVAKMKTGIGTN
jgi:branched-chain amino acid transport system substrate-binding protein